jgi:hypothetical protein
MPRRRQRFNRWFKIRLFHEHKIGIECRDDKYANVRRRQYSGKRRYDANHRKLQRTNNPQTPPTQFTSDRRRNLLLTTHDRQLVDSSRD